jgi:hypothetical protein
VSKGRIRLVDKLTVSWPDPLDRTGRCLHCGRKLDSPVAFYCPRKIRRCRQAAYERRHGLIPGRTRAVTARRDAERAARQGQS